MHEPNTLRPFDPNRPKTGLFTFTPDPHSSTLLTAADMRAMRTSVGFEGDKLAEFWSEVWRRDEYNLDDLFPFIVRVAWRLTRGLLVLRGSMQPDGFLNEVDDAQWNTPTPGSTPGGIHSLERNLIARPISILPPSPPIEWTNGDKDPAYYDPAADVALCDYAELMNALARRLSIESNKSGRLGLVPLVDLTMLRAAWPTPREIIAFESVMLDDAAQLLIEQGHLKARRTLKETHGFTDVEAYSLLLLARRIMRGMRVGTDTDIDKAAMVARLEDLASRMRDSLDFRGELMAYKTLAVVQGITKTQGVEDDVDNMVDTVDEVHAELLTEGEDDDAAE